MIRAKAGTKVWGVVTVGAEQQRCLVYYGSEHLKKLALFLS